MTAEMVSGKGVADAPTIGRRTPPLWPARRGETDIQAIIIWDECETRAVNDQAG